MKLETRIKRLEGLRMNEDSGPHVIIAMEGDEKLLDVFSVNPAKSRREGKRFWIRVFKKFAREQLKDYLHRVSEELEEGCGNRVGELQEQKEVIEEMLSNGLL